MHPLTVGHPRGFSLKMAAFSERGTLSRSSKRLSSWTSLKKSCSSKWFTTKLSPVVTTDQLDPYERPPRALPQPLPRIRGGVAPKGERITPCPKTMLGVVTPYHSRAHSLVGQRECMHWELGLGVVSADPLGSVGEGLGEPTIRLPLPLTRSDPYLSGH